MHYRLTVVTGVSNLLVLAATAFFGIILRRCRYVFCGRQHTMACFYVIDEQHSAKLNMEAVMSNESGKTGLGYEEMVWIRDKDGNEYACQFKEIKFIKRKEELTAEEVNRCVDVSQVLSKDNW